ncbi:hypothetical protein QBC34DRAFT_424114 [Podospora aff. communis PSN243]|uniref:Uncharacterized protein n=1 Tax=Podospora aff. communis PSN243 TaxID=3040156 RepID=A0AAV9GR31_9PEZI|nr:hypothetical protein QBC34DRAFT_424114 [Podospora aff. communis PSN243]
MNATLAINSTLVGFVPEPAARGTLSLLYSCSGALIICIWGALHLNLPKTNETAAQRIWQYLRWTLVALFFPELLIWFSRCLGALQHEWTDIHSFYAGMGGFVVDLQPLDVGIQETGCLGDSSQMVVTPHGVELLIIEDKNKADIFSKAVCCIQVGWLVFQSLERLRLQLPLSLLEVHTLAHVACALVLYGLWWHKPKMIVNPTRIPVAEGLDELVAFMFVASHLSAPDRHSSSTVHVSREAALRQSLARKALARFPCLVLHAQDLAPDAPSMPHKNFVTDHASNWPDHGLLRGPGDGLIGTCVWLASYLVFGGVLWAILAGLDLGWHWVRRLWGWDENLLRDTSGAAARCTLVPLMILGGALNTAARLFLFAESFASLRATLAQVYTSPQLSASIPHL